MSEDFPNVFHVLFRVIGVNQDIIKIYYYALV